MAENKNEETKWMNVAIPGDCISPMRFKTDAVNLVADPETGEMRAARNAWHVVTLPEGFELGGQDVGGCTFTIPVNPDKGLAEDRVNEGWKRIGLREGTMVKLRTPGEGKADGKITMVPAAQLVEAAKEGFSESRSEPVFINFSKRSVSGPIVNKETGKETYTATLSQNTVINGLDVGGYKVNFEKEDYANGKSNVFERDKSVAFMVGDKKPLELFLVDKDTGTIYPLAMGVTAGEVKEASEKSYEAWKESQSKAVEQDREQKTAKDAPKATRVAAQKKAAPAETAPAKTQAKS